MQLIAFTWTSAALLAGRKTVTRRDWKPAHRDRFHAGDLVQAWDRNPRNGGVQIATIRLTDDPVLESLRLIPDSDYEAEGFAFYDERVRAGDVDLACAIRNAMDLRSWETLQSRFIGDQLSDVAMTVVRFELVSVSIAGAAMKAKGLAK